MSDFPSSPIRVTVCIDSVWFDALDVDTYHRDSGTNYTVTVAYSIFAGILSFKPDLLQTIQADSGEYSPRQRTMSVTVDSTLSLITTVPVSPQWTCRDCNTSVYYDECDESYEHRDKLNLKYGEHLCSVCASQRLNDTRGAHNE